jgi:hypothetical protein
MKLGILLLILSLLIAGLGMYGFEVYSPLTFGPMPPAARLFFLLGLAGMIAGSGLAIVGSIRIMVAMIVSRIR